MGKKAKEHRKKVEKRKRIMEQEMRHFQKIQMQMFEKMMSERESSNTIIDTAHNTEQVPNVVDVPNTILSSTILNGPQI
jgi:hypothetical protein